MFASIELARRIEAAEANLTVAIADRARAAGETAVLAERIEAGAAVFVRHGAPMNKLLGVGFDGPVDTARLTAIEREFAARRATLQVELSTLARCEAAQQFASRGYRCVAFENVLGCDPRIAAADPPAHDVEPAPAATLPQWLSAMVDSFLAIDGSGAGTVDGFAREELLRVMGEMAALPEVRRFAVCKQGELLGGASMRLDRGIAQLCGAATVPAHRRRGVQTALLAARLREAARSGCDVAVVTAQPGSTSQQNAQRQGFALLYARAILIKEPP